MSQQAPGTVNPTRETGFRVALAEYPGCGMDAIKGEYRPYAHALITVGTADEEASPKICQSFANGAERGGADLELVVFEGAEHNYDDPGTKKQSNPANEHATEETMRKAERLFRERLMPAAHP